MIRRLFACFLITVAVSAAAQPVDKAALAKTAAGKATTARDKVRAVVDWANHSFEWTSTDYQSRTVDEIIARGGGNCFEQTVVVVALLKELGIETRKIREINIQPDSEQRQRNAEARVAKNGLSMSVFGLRHNDHVWIEFKDSETGEWTPADPTLNLVGFDQWLKARVGFGVRPTHPIVASRDMLVPIAIFAQDGSSFEPRSERYLVEGFDSIYGHKLQTLDGWRDWTAAIAALQAPALGAFEGKVNLHQHAAEILAAKTAYAHLAAEYAAMK